MAVLCAANDLGIWDALEQPLTSAELSELIGVSCHRLAALLDVLALEGMLERSAQTPARFGRGVWPDVPESLPLEGWGRLAEVIRRDEPLSPAVGFATAGESERRYQEHLSEVGRQPAAELTRRWLGGRGERLLDLGGGTGVYTAAFLDADPEGSAVLVDRPEVVSLAKPALGQYGSRVTFVEGEIESVALGAEHTAALMANLLHLHGEAVCKRLVGCAVDALAPGGRLVVKDLGIDADRAGPVTAVYFSLNMALYTRSGSVHAPRTIATWMAEAGLVDIETDTLSCSRDAVVVLGRKPPV